MLLSEIFDFVMSLRNTSICVYEWNESSIRKARLANSPDFYRLTTKQPDLLFSGWALAHAVVKADYLDRRNLTMPGLGFLLQSSNLLDFTKSSLTLKAGASRALNDVSFSSLSGRMGQGLAILYGHSIGMKFSAHLRSYVESLPVGSAGALHKGEAMADFLFSDGGNTILVESKGSFSEQTNDPTAIKSILKSALERQIDPWMTYLQPSPSNGYAVYSCLREDSWGPSAISVVDPSGDDSGSASLPLSSEQVMRENYGAWLRAMGLQEAAVRLMHGVSLTVADGTDVKPVETKFLVCERGGREFAFNFKQHFLAY